MKYKHWIVCIKCNKKKGTNYDGDRDLFVCLKCAKKDKIATHFSTVSTGTVATPSSASKTSQSKPVDMTIYVPNHNGYIPRKMNGHTDMDILKKAYQKKFNTLIVGETGCGKTMSIRDLCFLLKLPYMRVNLNEATTTEDLIGQWIPDSNGGFKWEDGVLVKFMRHGGVFVADEINASSPGILFILHSILDDERKVVLVQKDGEVVNAHPDFWFVSTMNPDYVGTRPLNAALKDRFQIIMEYDYDKAVEKKIVKDTRILELADKLRVLYKQGTLSTPVSTRALMQYVDNKSLFGEEMAQEMFINRFNSDERAPLKEVFSLDNEKIPDGVIGGVQ